jgi:hypothetical protein
MLLEKTHCPFGCQTGTISESTKRVVTGNSNLLLDSAKSTSPVTEIVKVYSCTCCGRSFESKQQTEGRTVL